MGSVISRLRGGAGSTPETLQETEGVEVCPICQDPLVTNDEQTTTLKCNPKHVFHTTCIERWVTTNPTCPYDRTPITTEDIIPPLGWFNTSRFFATRFAEGAVGGAWWWVWAKYNVSFIFAQPGNSLQFSFGAFQALCVQIIAWLLRSGVALEVETLTAPVWRIRLPRTGQQVIGDAFCDTLLEMVLPDTHDSLYLLKMLLARLSRSGALALTRLFNLGYNYSLVVSTRPNTALLYSFGMWLGFLCSFYAEKHLSALAARLEKSEWSRLLFLVPFVPALKPGQR